MADNRIIRTDYDKVLHVEATLVALQRQVDEMKANTIRITEELKGDLIRISDDIDSQQRVNGERLDKNTEKIHQIEDKMENKYYMNGERLHRLEVDQAKIVQAVQLGGYFIKMLWGLVGAVCGAILSVVISKLIG
jgi:hypothetical protein